MPQLIEQWRLKSADGIAIGFISIWFLGDLFNLAGSLWAGLLPEVIFLAIWFCIADFLMVFSYFYYTHIFPKHHRRHSHKSTHSGHSAHSGHHQIVSDETEPLVVRRRRSSTLTDIALEPSYHSVFTKYILPIIFVIGAGSLGYLLSDGGNLSGDDDTPDDPINVGPQVLGYISAALYLGARIPQIIQNHKRKSVEGLSLLFFLFSTLGNITYAGQILFFRSDYNYIVLNMSWLLGSVGTIFEDSIIFLQFYLYKDNDHFAIE
jgi:uncharacterized protein with PQ loop repeat